MPLPAAKIHKIGQNTAEYDELMEMLVCTAGGAGSESFTRREFSQTKVENENTDERAEIREDGILARHFTKRVPYKLPLIKTLSMKFHSN